MGRLVEVNQTVVLDAKLYDGATDQFPRARVYNSSGTEQTAAPYSSPITLTHRANGLYTATVTPDTEAEFVYIIQVYSDAGFTTLNKKYQEVADEFEVHSVDQDLATLLSRLTSGRATNLDNLDTTVSSRATNAGAASAVWNEAKSGHTTSGTFGETNQGIVSVARANNLDNLDTTISSRATNAGAASAVWDEIVTGHSTASSFGLLVKTDLDATVSSRNSTAHFDTILGTPVTSVSADIASVKTDTTTLTGRLTAGRATNLDNLDATVSSRAPASTALSTAQWTNTRAGNLDNLDATVSSRATNAGAASAVWEEIVTGHNTGSSFGLLVKTDLDAAVSSRAPASTALSTAQWTNTRAGNLDNLDATISSRAPAATALSTTQWTNTRATNLDNLDTTVSSRATNAGAASAVWEELTAGHSTSGSFGLLVKTDLDATISSRATAATAAASVWDELTASHSTAGSFGLLVKTDLDTTISSRAPASTALSTAQWTNTRAGNLDNLDTTVSSRNSTAHFDTILGTPVSSVSTDIASVKTDTTTLTGRLTAGRATNLDNLDATISSRAPAATALSTAQWTNTRAGNLDNLDTTVSSRATPVQVTTAVWDEARSGHTTSGTFGEAHQGVVSTTRANNLDNLDATISSRATQASVTSLQLNTDFVGVVPSPLLLPEAGSKNYEFYVRFFNDSGLPVDPDSNNVTVTIKDSGGVTVAGPTAMTRDAVSQYHYQYTVNSTDTERPLFVFFDYLKGGTAFNQVRATEVQEFESKLSTLLTLITPTRAANLDNLDATVSSRSTPAQAANAVWEEITTGHSTATSYGLLVKTDLDATMSSRAPASTALSTVQWTNTRAGNLDNLDTTVSSRATNAGSASAVWEELTAGHSTAGSFGLLVKTDLDATVSSRAPASTALSTAQWTNTRAAKLDNLDVAVSTRESEASAALRAALQQSLTTFETDIPTIKPRPVSGTDSFKAFGRLYDANGNATDPDSNSINVTVLDSEGGELIGFTGSNPMTRTAKGLYEILVPVADNEELEEYTVFFDYLVSGQALRHSETFVITVFASQIINIEAKVDAIKAKTDQLAYSGGRVDAVLSTAEEASIVDQIWDEMTTDHLLAGSTGKALNSALDPAQIADLVWDKSLASHTTAGTMGGNQNKITNIKAVTDQFEFDGFSNVYANSDVVSDKTGYSLSPAEHTATAAAVWDEPQAPHNVNGTFGGNLDTRVSSRESEVNADVRYEDLDGDHVQIKASLSAIKSQTDQLAFSGGNVHAEAVSVSDKSGYALSSASENSVVDKVWDEPLADHLSGGSTGLALSSGSDPAAIADAVWDESRAAHVTAGTFGQALDTPVSTRESEAAAAARSSLDLTQHSNTQSIATAIEAKTNQLTFTGSNVNADAQVVADKTGYSLAPGEDASIADAVWDEARAPHSTAGTFGEANQGVLSTARAAKIDNLDVATSTRAPASTAVSTASLTPTRIAALDNLDVPVSGRASQSSITSGFAAGAKDATVAKDSTVAKESTLTSMDAQITDINNDTNALEARLTTGRAANLDKLDVNVSTRSSQTSQDAGFAAAAQDATVAKNTDTAALSTQLAGVGTQVSGVQTTANSIQSTVGTTGVRVASTEQDAIVDKVWDELSSSHLIAGTTGKALADAGTASPSAAAIADAVWDEALSGHIAVGSAGANQNLVDDIQSDTSTLVSRLTSARATKLDNLDVSVSSRESEANAATRAANDQSSHATTQLALSSVASEVASVDSKIGSGSPSLTSRLSTLQTDVTAIEGQTSALPSDPASQATTNAQIAAATAAAVAAEATASAIKVKTDNLPASPASEGSVLAIPTNPVLASDGRLNYLDEPISSRATPLDLVPLATGSEVASAQSAIQTDIAGVLTALGPKATTAALLAAVAPLALQSTVLSISGDVATVLSELITPSDIWTHPTRTLTVPVDVTLDISALATTAQLNAAVAQIDADNALWEPNITAAIYTQTDDIEILAWLNKNGQRVTTATEAEVYVYDGEDNLIFDLGPDLVDTAQGVFRFTRANASTVLTGGKTYTVKVRIVESSIEYVANQSLTVF